MNNISIFMVFLKKLCKSLTMVLARLAVCGLVFGVFLLSQPALVYGADSIDATLTTNLASPQPTGTFVTVTSNGIGGSGNYEYQFRLNASGTWTTVQAYSTSNTWTWNTISYEPGVYAVGVSVRTGGSLAYPVEKTAGYSLYTVGNIYTIAGGVGDGAQAVSAELVNPGKIAIDALGHMYIADPSGNRVRKVDAATGVISTVAGNELGAYSGDGGPAALAALNYPSGVALDVWANIYIADLHNNRVRKVDAATGVITTVAGSGTAGYSGDNSVAVSANLNQPAGIALDAMGNMYISDTSNNRIRKVDAASGVITTAAGNGTSGYSGDNGPAAAARLQSPSSVVVDDSGNIYIADTNNSRIRRVDAITGVITTVAGNGMSGYSGDNGAATAAALNKPSGMYLNSRSDIYIADTYNNRIRKVNAATGVITTIAGTGTYGYAGDNGPAVSANLAYPSGVLEDAAGNILIADSYGGNGRIRRVEAATGVITTVAGVDGTYAGDNGPALSALLYMPGGVAYDSSGNIFIADTYNQRIRRVDAITGVITTVAGNGTEGYSGDNSDATSASLNNPAGVAFDGTGTLYIADTSNNRIRKVDALTGVITTAAGCGTAGYSGDNGSAAASCLNGPSGVALDNSGNMYIADANNHCIRRVDAITGVITTVAGNGTGGYSGDGSAATSASLNDPSGVALDTMGTLYIADTSNNRIRKVHAITGVITTVAGNGTAGYSGDDGPATSAGLNYPKGVAVDGMGGIMYIADAGNYRMRKVNTTTGVITTTAGSETHGFAGDNGPAAAAGINYPYGVAVDTSGNVYIADRNNNRTRKIAAFDATPNAFSFVDQTGAAVNTQVISNAIMVTGINSPVAISTAGGEYEVNGNSLWTSATGTIYNGCSVRLRRTSSSNYGTRTDTILSVGGVSGTFRVTTLVPDTTPDPFTFTAQTGVAVNTLIISNSITVTGINVPALVTISGGEYELNNSGVWMNTSGAVANGNTVRVRQTSSTSYGTRADTILSVGGVSGTFGVTTLVPDTTSVPFTVTRKSGAPTLASDTTPDPFAFTARTGVAVNTLIISNSITVTGINVPATVRVSGGEYELNNSGVWTNAIGTVTNGTTIRVRLISSASYNATTSAALAISGNIGTGPTGSAIAWDAPTTYTNGSLIDPGATLSFTSGCGTSPGIYSLFNSAGTGLPGAAQSESILNAVPFTAVDGLYFCSVTAADPTGNVSDYSNEISFVKQGTTYLTSQSAVFSVTTMFNAYNVMIPGASPAYFTSLQSALDTAANGDTIMSRANEFIENLVVSRPVSNVLSGGYDNSFSSINGFTTINGSLTIGGGAITIGSGAFSIY